MTAIVQDIISLMDEIAPLSLSEPWDNSGLQVGDRQWPVATVMISLDPTRAVLAEAEKKGVDMLITHHPLIFSPVKKIDLSTPLGEMISTSVRNRIAVYAAHTNLDIVPDGLNDELAGHLGLEDLETLSPTENTGAETDGPQGLGRIGALPEPLALGSLVRRLKERLGIDTLRISGKLDIDVRRVALCTGSGGSLLEPFFKSGADVYITGDIRYHDARNAEEMGRTLVDIGHYGSEKIVIELLFRKLAALLEERAMDVRLLRCGIEKDPFYTL